MALTQTQTKFNAPELVADVLDGVQFKDGERVTETDTDPNIDNQTIDEKVAA